MIFSVIPGETETLITVSVTPGHTVQVWVPAGTPDTTLEAIAEHVRDHPRVYFPEG